MMPLMPLQFEPADQFVKLGVAFLYDEGAVFGLAHWSLRLIPKSLVYFPINALKTL